MDRIRSRGKGRQARRNIQRATYRVPQQWRDRAGQAAQALAALFFGFWQTLPDLPRRVRLLFLIKGWSWRIRFGLFAVLSVLLLWLVVSKSYLAYVEDAGSTSGLDPIDSEDYLSLAERRLRIRAAETSPPAQAAETSPFPQAVEAAPPRQAAESSPPAPGPVPNPITAELGNKARAQAVALLAQRPLDARSLRILGELAVSAGNQGKAAALMQAAARRSLRETAALVWLTGEHFKRGEFDKTAHYADALLRTRPQLVGQVTPVLARMAENKDAAGVLKDLLAANPPWRRAFFSSLPRNVSDARTPLDLLLSLREKPTPPGPADLRAYLNFLIKHGFYEVAYYAWLQFLPPEQLSGIGFLYNGSFETKSSKLPFDWVIGSGSGVTIDVIPPPEDQTQKALYIEFGYGRVNLRGVTQMIMLSPGTYQLRGKYKGEVTGRRGLRWRIACAGGRRLGKSDMVLGTKPEWQQFKFSFTVPDRDCRAQKVSLVLDSRSASERFVTGSIWYDDLEISRDQPAATPPSESP